MFLPPRRVRSAVHQFLLQEIVPQFDELGGDLLPLASTSASQEAEDPKINMDLGDRLLGFGRDFGTFADVSCILIGSARAWRG